MSPHAQLDESTAITDTQGAPLPNPLAFDVPINDIFNRREKAKFGQWGVAAASEIDAYKIKKHSHKPLAKTWDHYLTDECTGREGSALKDCARFLATPGLISLGGGLPSSEYFPYSDLSVKVPQIGAFSEAETAHSGVTITAGKHDLADGKSIFDIATALNYGQGSGAAQLLRWITEHTELVFNPPYRDWACTMTVGSTDAFEKALRMFTVRGDYVIGEEYTFSSAVDTMRGLGVKVAGVAMDAEGMLPDKLDEMLRNWDSSKRDGAKRPHIMYTIPSGQNPTGATAGVQRRKDILAVGEKWDIFIIEDDPYYFIQMDPHKESNSTDEPSTSTPNTSTSNGINNKAINSSNGTTPSPASALLPTDQTPFLRSLLPSYLTLSTTGRVLRLDTFSKLLGPGTRVGWITGPAPLIEHFRKHADLTTQAPSGLSQLVLYKLLDEHWGHAGYLSWLTHLRKEYTRRRSVMLAAAQEHLPREVVSWSVPRAGMFFWMRIEHASHPRVKELSVKEIETKLFRKGIDKGALVIPGSYFQAEQGAELSGLFFRATFAAASEVGVREAVGRFGRAIREEWGLDG